MRRVNVYIDGFNLYYSALRGTPYKWLDVVKLADQLIPELVQDGRVERVRYFTARVTALPHDPDVAIRQDAYLRALATLPRLTIHEGHFRRDSRMRELVTPCTTPQCSQSMGEFPVERANIWQSEEKGSDVNLGVWMMRDCALDPIDAVVAVTNDSDLATPLKLATTAFGKSAYLLNPQWNRKRWTHRLRAVVAAARVIGTRSLETCQLPETMTDAGGRIEKPTSW